mgnify:FL=1
MNELLVVFSRGKESGPRGSKIRALMEVAELYLPSYGCQDPVPPNHSIRFTRQHRCALHLLEGDHRLNAALPAIEPLFGGFLQDLLKHSPEASQPTALRP